MASSSQKTLGKIKKLAVLEVEGKLVPKVFPGEMVKAKPSMVEGPNRLVLEACF